MCVRIWALEEGASTPKGIIISHQALGRAEGGQKPAGSHEDLQGGGHEFSLPTAVVLLLSHSAHLPPISTWRDHVFALVRVSPQGKRRKDIERILHAPNTYAYTHHMSHSHHHAVKNCSSGCGSSSSSASSSRASGGRKARRGRDETTGAATRARVAGGGSAGFLPYG